MKIVGVMIWADEAPSMLATAVHGLGKVADEIVAVDGFYALYPGATVRSHPDQAEAIIRAAETEDVGCTIHRPRDLFYGNEVEKRNVSFKIASAFCQEGDWLLVWDADFHLHRCDRDSVRAQLEETDCLAATYTVVDGQDVLAKPELAQMARDIDVDHRWTVRCRGLYRWTPDITYEYNHYSIRGTYDGELRWVYGPEMWQRDMVDAEGIVPAHDLLASLVVYHRRSERSRLRAETQAAYYRIRDASGVEQTEPAYVFTA